MTYKKNEIDIKFMKDWSIAILSSISERYDHKHQFEKKIENATKYCEEGNTNGLKRLYKEIYIMAVADLMLDEKLNNKLLQQFGKVLNDVKPSEQKRKNLTDDKLKELSLMKHWTMTIYEYLKSQFSEDAEYLPGKKYHQHLQTSLDIINSTFEKNDLRGMKMIYMDTNEMARGIPMDQMIELNKILLRKFGKSLVDEEKEIKKTIAKIVKRGKINTDEEYYLLKPYIDELLIEGKKEEAQKLDFLIYEHENSRRK
jgi:hypothetical protein